MIDIVIVNWNAGAHLGHALDSIERFHDGLVDSVTVVDNASSDDSLELLDRRDAPTFTLRVLRNMTNLGFGAACNLGAKDSREKLLLFLNPDARIESGCLSKAVTYLEDPRNAQVGIVGAQLRDQSGQIARSCARFPTLGMFGAHALGIDHVRGFQHLDVHMIEWAHDTTTEVDHVIGAFFLVRRSIFAALGGFDERYFLYYEDLDFSLRARELGYRSVFLSEAHGFHVGGGISKQIMARRLFYSLRSRLLYGFKNFEPAEAWALFALTIFIEPASRTGFAILRRRPEDVLNLARAYGMLFRELPAVIGRR